MINHIFGYGGVLVAMVAGLLGARNARTAGGFRGYLLLSVVGVFLLGVWVGHDIG